MTEPLEVLAGRAARIRERIADAGGDPERVALLAVSKGQPASSVVAAARCGLVDIGESYAQEMVAKVEDLAGWAERGDQAGEQARVRWHLIGRLQRNKVRLVAPSVHLWQSIDRLSLAAEVARRVPGAAVLVQVNVTGLDQQGGCPPERVAAVVEGCTDLGLGVRGLMAIGPLGTPEASCAAFRTVRELADQLGLAERSIGMSNDLEAAVAEGSTMVRVGTALFGPRRDASAGGNTGR